MRRKSAWPGEGLGLTNTCKWKDLMHFCENAEFCVVFFNIFNSLAWMLYFSDPELPKVEIVREKKPVHDLVIEVLLAFYLLSCFDFSRAYLNCLLSKGYFYTCANKWWSAHHGHSSVAVCEEGCSERLSLTLLYMANPISSCICRCGKSSCSQSECYRVIENTAYCGLLFLF